MQVLVTGATGFIGRRLTAALLERFGPRSLTCLVHTPRNPAEAEAALAFATPGSDSSTAT
jgi:thioester reductase-like protein